MEFGKTMMGLNYLDKRLGGLQEVLLALGTSTLLMPVDDRLVRNAVFVV